MCIYCREDVQYLIREPEFMQWVQQFCHYWKWRYETSSRMVIIPEHPGNDVLIAAISFSEIKRNHWGPNQASKEAAELQ